jgi:hypothetical protein
MMDLLIVEAVGMWAPRMRCPRFAISEASCPRLLAVVSGAVFEAPAFVAGLSAVTKDTKSAWQWAAEVMGCF